jgi:flagellar biosynthetic protein FliR
MILTLPGIGGGMSGMAVRYPLVLVLSVVSLTTHPAATLPADVVAMSGQILSEIVLGGAVSIVPLMIVAGAQTAGQIASGTMGLNGAQLIDPTTNVPISDVSRIYSDLTVVMFLTLGGHYVAIGQLAGLGRVIQPGTFVLGASGVESLVMQSAHIFEIGCMIASPVIVALLLTNFVMALISKAVPTVNLFMLSYPLTIGIGFVLSAMALPEVAWFLRRQILDVERLTAIVLGF